MLSIFSGTDLGKELTLPLFLVSLYASLGGASFGIDFNYWSGFLGMTQFKKDFGVWDDTAQEWIIPSTWTSVATGTPQAGLAVGALISGFIGRRFGRVKCLFIAAAVGLVGIFIQAASIHSFWQLMVGRIINSISMGIICNVVPAYLSECAPAGIRGSLINSYQVCLLIGGLFAQTANWGLHNRTDQWAYRVVLILQFLIPVLIVAGAFFLPESPRWLVEHGRHDEALRVLQKLRTRTPPAVVEREAQLLVAAEEDQARNFQASTWLDCFRGGNLRRTLIAIGVQALQAAQGNSFMANYSVIFLQTVGIQNTYKIQVLLIFVNMSASAFAFYFADKLGRRPILIGAAAIMAICMYAVAGVTGYSDDLEGQKGALAALFVWQFVQAVGWSSCVWITTAEVPTLHLREKTITLATFTGYVVSLMVTYINPFMQDAGYGNLGGKVGFVYGSFSVAAVVWTMFVVPELKGRSLEELDELFEKRVSVWRFKNFKAEGLGAQVTEIEGVAVVEEELVLGKEKEVVGKETGDVV